MLSAYFKERKGFDRLFQLLKKKYMSLGRYSGVVTLINITEEEARDFTNFFGKRIEAGTSFRTSFRNIEKKLRQTKYKDFTWESLFTEYFGEKVIDKKKSKEEFLEEEKRYFDFLKKALSREEASFLDGVLAEKTSLYPFLLKRYKKDKEKLEKDLVHLIKLLFMIDDITPTSLVMLSSITGNPHFLDFKGQNSTLFFKLLAFKEKKREPKSTIGKITFLEQHQIYIDTVSNFVITYKLQSENAMVTSFTKEGEPLNLTLSNIEKIQTLDTKEKRVYIFENPSMLMALKHLDVPIVITYGNPNLVVYKVLEKLEESNNALYYNGDFDPEGLLIADSLKEKFPSLRFFAYKMEDYKRALSQEVINESRLRKLKKLKKEELIVMKELLEKHHFAAYQEKNIKRIEEFIGKNEGKML